MKEQKLSTDPYKGVRDFYPEDMALERYLFSVMRDSAERFGYEEYTASPLEPTELYVSKGNEEIINEQTYTFIDRGDRSVTLRPEMTPTVARMVAAKRRELAYPLRWYSIPNCFRYERPQKGRLREFYQLNCDLFGVKGIEADVEIILLAYEIMKGYGATPEMFEIKIYSRKLLNYWAHEVVGMTEEQTYRFTKVLDRWGKMSSEEFRVHLAEIVGDETRAEDIMQYLTSEDAREGMHKIQESEEMKEVKEVMRQLIALGVPKEVLKFDPTLARGFDYYTGIVFEVFDTHPDNRRSIFGGGRYDNLLDMFGAEPLPAVGFGMGDAMTEEFLKAHNLLPEYQPTTTLYICAVTPEDIPAAQELAHELRGQDISVAVDLSGKKLGDQYKVADKKKIPFVLTIGSEEKSIGIFKIKNLATGEESPVERDQIADWLFERGLE
jgi:histidyl-tRNA synthetase